MDPMKSRKEYKDIEILKERQRLRILEQELKLKSEFRDLGEYFTAKKIQTSIQENLLGGSGIAFKLGFLAVNLIMDRMRNRGKK